MEICDTGPTRGQKVAKNKKTHISAISNLKCMYTNCDTLTNKTSELKLAIDSNHPDIIALTEVTPKNNRYILQKSEIEIKGYNLYISDFEETNTRANTDQHPWYDFKVRCELHQGTQSLF